MIDDHTVYDFKSYIVWEKKGGPNTIYDCLSYHVWFKVINYKINGHIVYDFKSHIIWHVIIKLMTN